MKDRIETGSRWTRGLLGARTAILSLLSALLIASASPLQAQDTGGTIRGRILNAQTNRFMEQAQVQVEGSAKRTFTNQRGEYELYGLQPGEVELLVSYTGMDSQRATVTVVGGESVEQDFTFRGRATREGDSDVFELAELQVVAADSFQTASEIAIQAERFSVNLKSVVDTEAYGITAQGNVGEFVKFIPGVTIGYGGSSSAGGTYSSPADANTISVRGFDPRETVVTVDGIPQANAAPGTLDPAFGLDMLSINNASRIEVIKVPTPDQPNAGVGGTVNLISKSAFEYPKPTLNFRVYVGLNSENLDIFEKTPGPMNKPTYKAQPSFDLTYAVPFSDSMGITLTLASANQVNEENVLKARITRNPLLNVGSSNGRPTFYSENQVQRLGSGNSAQDFNRWLTKDPRFGDWQQQYGEDWTQWTETDFRAMYGGTNASESVLNTWLGSVKRLPRYDSQGNRIGLWSASDKERFESLAPVFYDAEGNRIGHVYPDWTYPYMHRIQVTDSPRISHRNSAALKFDWRPFTGMVISTNYQVSTFEDQSAGRRVHRIGGIPFEFGPDYSYTREGSVRLDTDAFGRDSITQSGYVKASFIKGPWEIGGHLSHSNSESELLSIEKGHFSQVQLTTGSVDLTEYLNIDQYGAPEEINYYRNVTDAAGNVTGRQQLNINSLESYGISGFDPNDPDAGVLRVRSAGIESVSEVTTAKFDVRRELDFLNLETMNLAIKIGGNWEERTETKGGRGINYSYVYLGREVGAPIRPVDFRDNNYLGVDPGFNMQPIEWPDPFQLYRYAQANPDAFSDTDDRVPSANDVSVAHHNWIESVNTTKGITETTTAYYAQLEGDFMNNRLSVVGGFRMSESERSGYDRGRNYDWRFLHFNRDENQDGILDVFEGYQVPGGAVLDRLDLVQPTVLFNQLRTSRVSTFEQLSPASQQIVLDEYRRYEQAGAVYPDGTPFIADEFVLLNSGELRAAKYQYLRAFPIKQKAQSRPQPIISASYDITEKLVARASWAITYSNPPYESSQGAAGTLRQIEYSRNPDGSGSMSVSNPGLKVARTQGWDVGLSYYTDAGGQFSILGYFREEEDRAISAVFSPNTSPDAWHAVMVDLGYGPGHQYYENEWTVNTSRNSAGTFVDYGFELEGRHDLSFLSFLGDWGNRIYLYGSYFQQFQKSGSVPEGEESVFLVPEGMESRINASGGVNFNYKRLNLRVNFTWRNERLDGDSAIAEVIFWDDPYVGNAGWYTPTEADNGNEAYLQRVRLMRPADLRIDFSGSYRLTDHFTLDFSARNITESNPEPVWVREDGGSLGPMVFSNVDDGSDKILFGINFTIGLSGRF